MQWGWNPDTVAAFATASATLLAAVAALLAVLDVLRSRRRDDRRQAYLIAAWTEIDETERNIETGSGIRAILHVANQSELPVTTVWVTLAVGMGEVEHEIKLFKTVGPGQVIRTVVVELSAHEALGNPYVVNHLRFTDSEDRVWDRDANGLKAAASSAAPELPK